MAAIIQIRDGDPWWLSPDIRVVPGNDPNGPSGIPVAGTTNYVWATVHNTGKQGATGIQVNFYWSNPAAGVLRSNSTAIGQAFVDLDAGETKEVLCLTPWVPVVVNEGHECVVAEAITPFDPLPTPLTDAFEPKDHHQIAQRNLHVITVDPNKVQWSLPIQISAPHRRAKKVLVRITNARLDKEQEARLFKSVGLKKALPHADLVTFGLSQRGGCGDGKDLPAELKLEVAGGEATAVHAQLHLKDLKVSGYQLLHVSEQDGDKVLGGNSILILHP